MKTATPIKPANFAALLLATVLVLVPFQAFLTVFASSFTGHYDIWRLWKEVVILLVVPLAGFVLWRDRAVWKRLRGEWLLWALVCYVLLHFLLGLVALAKGQVNAYALAYALIINLRLVAVFLSAWILAQAVPWLGSRWKQLLLWPAAVVVGFGLLQVFVLPDNFLTHFGYSPATIQAYQTVDSKADFVRIQSTLRGANPLGAYLVITIAGLLVTARRVKGTFNTGLTAAVLLTGTVLFFSYSRSAYVGLLVTLAAAVILAVRNRREQRWLAVSLAAVVLIAGGLFAAFHGNDYVENTIFHTNEDSRSAASSNAHRANAMRAGVRDVISEPFGRGPGTAGPASVHNDRPARIAENYYVQIGQETGWLGLGLLAAILVMISKKLWRRRDQPLARAMLISLAGLCFVNLVQHAWTDDTLAYVWWGFAGIAMSLPVTKEPGRLAGLAARLRSRL